MTIDDDRVYRRNEDPDTSHASAAELKPAAYWLVVVDFLVKNDRPQGWTDYEIEQQLPDRLGACPWHRVSDVRRKGWAGWIFDESGNKVKRPGAYTAERGACRITIKGRAWRQENLQGSLF